MTCYEEGRIAHGEGAQFYSCPYTEPHLRKAWQEGWQEAENDRKEQSQEWPPRGSRRK
jgi:ribosome modulation factor